MKSRENLVRLKQFQVNEKRRQLLQLDMMIAEFERMAVELEAQIVAEEKKAGITDIKVARHAPEIVTGRAGLGSQRIDDKTPHTLIVILEGCARARGRNTDIDDDRGGR